MRPAHVRQDPPPARLLRLRAQEGLRSRRHPDSLWVREDALLDGLHEFLSHHVFGPYRHQLLAATLGDIDQQAAQTRSERITAIKKTIADLDNRTKRLVRSLEVGSDTDEPDHELIQDIKNRRAELKAQRATLAAELEALEEHAHDRPNPDLLNALPIGACDLDALPDDIARRLFEALRLEIHYNKTDNTALCRITLSGETIPVLQHAAGGGVVVAIPDPRSTAADDVEPSVTTAAALFPSAVCTQQGNIRTQNLLVDGLQVSVAPVHVKIRRDGYRRR